MGAWDTVRVELEEQRCLIEQQQVTIQRQQRKLELQLRLTAEMQEELDRIRLVLQQAAPGLYPTPASLTGGNGNGHPAAARRHRAAVSDSANQ
jgi:invasion protein IalB